MTWTNNMKRLLLAGVFFATQLNAMSQTYASKNLSENFTLFKSRT